MGGRFSVLTPVGLLPAAMMGIDVGALLAGAGDMRARCEGSDWTASPAGAFAVLQWLADTRHGRSGHVFMPYSDQLRDCAAWFIQLWAESLGKIRPDGTHVGPTPIAALGATDQHSQVQLFMEGPADKTVTFVTVADGSADLTIPSLHGHHADLAYLGGHRLGELLAVEQQATAGALAARGRLSMTLSLDRVDAWHVGALFMLLEIATALAGSCTVSMRSTSPVWNSASASPTACSGVRDSRTTCQRGTRCRARPRSASCGSPRQRLPPQFGAANFQPARRRSAVGAQVAAGTRDAESPGSGSAMVGRRSARRPAVTRDHGSGSSTRIAAHD